MSGMKKMRLISAVLGIGKKVLPFCLFTFLPLSLMAQDDDMYFVPSKENVAKEAKTYGMPRNTYYSGSQRSVDEYNRRGMSSLTPIDSAGNDIIDFSAVRGVYPDSTYTDQADNDYQLTRKMSRFDDYTPSEAYWDGYRDGRWSSPWYHSWYSWYDYDPWYWNSPWYWGYNRYWGGPLYGGPHWHGGGHHSTGRPTNHRPRLNGSNYGGYRDNSSRPIRNTNYNPSSFGGSRSSGSGSSFGGGHSSGGGGSFGGGRSASGGRSFGGRK